MIVKRNTKISNNLIALGYCLLVVLLLLNYFGVTPQIFLKKKSEPEMATRVSLDNGLESPISELYDAWVDNTQIFYSHLNLLTDSIKGSANIKLAANLDFDSRMVVVPSFNREALQKIINPQKSPFIPGKNPFKHSQIEFMPLLTGHAEWHFHGVAAIDAYLPVLIGGADSTSSFTSNYH